MIDTTDILIQFGNEYLALSREQFEEARQRGQEIMRPNQAREHATQEDAILDADGMEARTGIPATWWLEQARRGKVPHLKAGKYVRFSFTDAIAYLKAADRQTVTLSGGGGRGATGSKPYEKAPRSATTFGGAMATRPKAMAR